MCDFAGSIGNHSVHDKAELSAILVWDLLMFQAWLEND